MNLRKLSAGRSDEHGFLEIMVLPMTQKKTAASYARFSSEEQKRAQHS
jgi:hypothetical protein